MRQIPFQLRRHDRPTNRPEPEPIRALNNNSRRSRTIPRHFSKVSLRGNDTRGLRSGGSGRQGVGVVCDLVWYASVGCAGFPPSRERRGGGGGNGVLSRTHPFPNPPPNSTPLHDYTPSRRPSESWEPEGPGERGSVKDTPVRTCTQSLGGGSGGTTST